MLKGPSQDHKLFALQNMKRVRQAEKAVLAAPAGACTMRLRAFRDWAYFAGMAHAELLGARQYGLERKFRAYQEKAGRRLHNAVMDACD